MKNYKIIMAVTAGLFLAVAPTEASLTYDFSNLLGANIQFNSGSTFQLNPGAPGAEFGGIIGATPYTGYITGAPWTIGAIAINGATQTANITTPGTLTITAAGGDLTGNLTWGTIQTSGTGDNINITGKINVTDITTTDSTLLALLGGQTKGVFTLSTTYNGLPTLTELVAGLEASHPTTFQGSLTSVPETTTFLAGALMLLPFGIGAIRSIRKDRFA